MLSAASVRAVATTDERALQVRPRDMPPLASAHGPPADRTTHDFPALDSARVAERVSRSSFSREPRSVMSVLSIIAAVVPMTFIPAFHVYSAMCQFEFLFLSIACGSPNLMGVPQVRFS